MRPHVGPDFLRAFGQGIGAGALLLALAALGLQLGSGAILRHEEAKLAQQVVPVHRPGDAAAERQAAAQATPLTAPPPETPARPDTVVETKKPDIPNDAPLAPAPIAGLYEEADGSRLPMIGQDGATPFRAYRRPFDIYAGDQPVIALGVTGLGLSASAFADALKNLPPEVSFVLSPYGSDLDSLTQQALRAKLSIANSVPSALKASSRPSPSAWRYSTSSVSIGSRWEGFPDASADLSHRGFAICLPP